MAIKVRCSVCRKCFDVSDKFAGKSGSCPNCKNRINIPYITIGDTKSRAALREFERSEKNFFAGIEEDLNAEPKWKKDMKTLLVVVVFVVIGVYIGLNLTKPEFEEPNIYELTRQAAQNSRYIFILLFTLAFAALGVGISDLRDS